MTELKMLTKVWMLSFAAGLVLSSPALAGMQVANYATGQRNTATYEHFSFWSKGGKPVVEYSYGHPERELKLAYLGKTVLQGKPAFKVRFPNALVLYVSPQGKDLKVVDGKGKYSKLFKWEYEGPVNGIGTFCQVCAEDETAAIALLKQHYLK